MKQLHFKLQSLAYTGVYDERSSSLTGLVRNGAKTAHVSITKERWVRLRVENTSGGPIRVIVTDGGSKRLPWMFDMVMQFAFVWVRTRVRSRKQVIRVTAQPIRKSGRLPERCVDLGTSRKPYKSSYSQRASEEFRVVGKKEAFRIVLKK